MDKACELCGTVSEMDFNAVVPVSEEKALLIKADVCFSCFGNYPDDTALAIALLEKRVEQCEDGLTGAGGGK